MYRVPHNTDIPGITYRGVSLLLLQLLLVLLCVRCVCMWKDSVFGTTRMWVTTTERVWERIRHTVTRTQIIIKNIYIYVFSHYWSSLNNRILFFIFIEYLPISYTGVRIGNISAINRCNVVVVVYYFFRVREIRLRNTINSISRQRSLFYKSLRIKILYNNIIFCIYYYIIKNGFE